jgi:hypothetical protein
MTEEATMRAMMNGARAGVLVMAGSACGLACGLVVLAGTAQAAAPDVGVAVGVAEGRADVEAQARAMLVKAQGFMRSRQHASGGWGVREQGPVFPAITGLVVLGMVDGPRGAESTVATTDPAMQKALEFLLSKQAENGGIFDQVLPSYNTAIALSALTRYPDEKAKEAAVRALAFLRTLQWSEEAANQADMTAAAAAVGREHAFYGGVGYGRHGRPDLSNTAFFVEALRDAGVEKDDPAFQRALVFLARTQMLDRVEGATKGEERVNDAAYAAGSTQGGFIYSTSVNKDRVGVGQSFAGDVAESLSGPPGVVLRLTFGKADDGSVRMVAKSAVEEAMARVAAGAGGAGGAGGAWPGGAEAKAMVLLGQTPDNVMSGSMEVRTPMTDVEGAIAAATPVLREAFPDVAIAAEPVAAWQGVSRLRAYGSMTYSGFKSLVYAGLTAEDPRVAAARGWIERNYTVDENPALGTDGYYYYLVAFGKALQAAGMERVKTPTGEREWRADLITRLATLQNEDGSFRSVDDRWMENDPELITAYAMIALQHALRE